VADVGGGTRSSDRGAGAVADAGAGTCCAGATVGAVTDAGGGTWGAGGGAVVGAGEGTCGGGAAGPAGAAADAGGVDRGQVLTLAVSPTRAAAHAKPEEGAETVLTHVFRKAEFWKKHAEAELNKRQRDILNRLLDGFEGKLTSSKYAMIEKCSPDTALRDISELVERGILAKDVGGGRNTSYSLTDTQPTEM